MKARKLRDKNFAVFSINLNAVEGKSRFSWNAPLELTTLKTITYFKGGVQFFFFLFILRLIKVENLNEYLVGSHGFSKSFFLYLR